MRIDLHLHTAPRSPCSTMDPVAAAIEAKRLGLDAVCFTEHHVLWPRDELDRVADAAGIGVIGGCEITTDQGDILVFGLDTSVPGVLPIAELRRIVEDDGGYMVAAHPFRGFKMFGLGQLGLDPKRSADRPLFSYVDAVEVCNGRLTAQENATAARVAGYLGLPGIAGSDAHRLDEIGHCVTDFADDIVDERELIAALRARRFELPKVSDH